VAILDWAGKLALIIAVAIFAAFIIAAALNTPSKGQIILNEKAEYLLEATLGPSAIKPTVGLYMLFKKTIASCIIA